MRMSRRTLNSTVAKTTPGDNARLQGFHKYEINEDVPESLKNRGSAARASGPSALSAADEPVHLQHIVACRNQYYHNAPVPTPSDEIVIDIINDAALKFSKTLLQQVEDYKATQALLSDLHLFPRCPSQTSCEPVQCNDFTAAATNVQLQLFAQGCGCRIPGCCLHAEERIPTERKNLKGLRKIDAGGFECRDSFCLNDDLLKRHTSSAKL